ncbi:hypothetical protein AXX17_AT2G30820 [Arabidopsis thaliana]|uniref:Uncharacterized protein n=1 Tax=Arabidopsis thaliana TaxID=3702 RepID=A0A178VVS8_ARATH|nr:hypothetical protein AXX17_AT2G30820 [Arabidopsis thaliana]
MADQDFPSVINIVLLVKLLDHVAATQNQNSGNPYTHQEGNNMPGEKEKKIEPKNLTEAELITMEEKSRMEHEHTMNIMEHKVEHALKQNEETYDKEMQHCVIDVSNSTDKVLIKDRPHKFGVILAQLSNYHLLLFCMFYCFCFFYFCIFPTLL